MKKLIILLMLFTFMPGCKQKENTSDAKEKETSYYADRNDGVKTGGVKMVTVNTPSGNFKVWTKTTGNNPHTRLLLLHGGPGCTHEYWECMESFLPREGIEFIYYDQLGSAYSDQPNDTGLWITSRFVEEVEQVRKALGLDKDNFFLLGHSWGGILAMEYAMKYQDQLKGLIISNMMASCPAYGRYADEVLAKQMDPLILDSIRWMEENNDFQNPRYMELLVPHFYAEHICRIQPENWPDPMVRCFNKINQQVYTIMQGPSEFGISGRLANWDRSNDLKNIKVPTLVIGAKYDTMDPEYMRWMAGQIHGASYLYCPNGSHMCMYDDQEVYMNGLIKFLKGVE